MTVYVVVWVVDSPDVHSVWADEADALAAAKALDCEGWVEHHRLRGGELREAMGPHAVERKGICRCGNNWCVVVDGECGACFHERMRIEAAKKWGELTRAAFMEPQEDRT